MGHVVSYTDLRANLRGYMDAVCDNHAPLWITRKKSRSVVLIAEDDYESLMETVHLLRSPANTKRLLESIQQAVSGDLAEQALIEPDKAG